MPDILHKVGIKTSPEKVYQALATTEGLAAWWTADTRGDDREGGVIQFRFGTRGGFDMKVLKLEPAQHVMWQVIEGPSEWMGTQVSFELQRDGDFTNVLFKHRGWKQPVEFMHHCSTKWALFLMSIKSLLETGKGAPYPDDVHVGKTD